MSVVKYKLERLYPDQGGTIPNGIIEGGYYYCKEDYTFLGWFDDSNSSNPEFPLALPKSITAVKLTKEEAIDRQLAMIQNNDPAKSEVINEISVWYDTIYNKYMKVNTGYIPSSSDVNDVRESKILVGCNVSISNVGTIYVTGSEKDIRNLAGLAQSAMIRISENDTTTINFRDGNNNMYVLTPSQVLSLWQKSSNYVSAVYQSSWNLKAMNPIPQDFKSNTSYWPSNNL